jgi:spermidine synthase
VNIKELGYQKTPLGDLTLRRRTEPRLQDQEVLEIKLGDEYLMSSLFTESERQLAILSLAPLTGELDVVIGGLGLGYTAVAALKDSRVSRLLVIDLFQSVIDWHHQGFIPNGEALTNDTRCELRQGDFFELTGTGFDVTAPSRKFDAVLLDIDHSPEHHLNETNRSFYTAEGLANLRDQLKPSGCFALWSNDPASEGFTKHLRTVFAHAEAYNVEFANPYTGSMSINSVYTARTAGVPRSGKVNEK